MWNIDLTEKCRTLWNLNIRNNFWSFKFTLNYNSYKKVKNSKLRKSIKNCETIYKNGKKQLL